jgi:hypothetical protein
VVFAGYTSKQTKIWARSYLVIKLKLPTLTLPTKKIPEAFFSVPSSICSILKIWRTHFLVLSTYTLIILSLSTVCLWIADSQLTTYLSSLENKGEIPPAHASRLLLVGRFAIGSMFSPLLFLASFYPHTLSLSQKTVSFDSVFRGTFKGLKSSISAWYTVLKKTAQRAFFFVLFLCACAFVMGYYQQEWIDFFILILTAIYLGPLLLSITSLLALPWFTIRHPDLEHKKNAVVLIGGALWIVFLIVIIEVAILGYTNQLIITYAGNMTIPLVKIASLFTLLLLTQPGLWLISATCSNYCKLEARHKRP